MRDLETIDSELRLLAAVHRIYGGYANLMDQLLDERGRRSASCQCWGESAKRRFATAGASLLGE